jgi:hypothetical protein
MFGTSSLLLPVDRASSGSLLLIVKNVEAAQSVEEKAKAIA